MHFQVIMQVNRNLNLTNKIYYAAVIIYVCFIVKSF